MKDERLVCEVMGRLKASVELLAQQLEPLAQHLDQHGIDAPTRMFRQLSTPLEQALAALTGILASCDAHHIERHEAEIKDDGVQDIEEPVAILLWLDNRLSRLLVELGFSLTMTSGQLPRDVHKALSELLGACETVRHDLDEMADTLNGHQARQD